MPIQANQLRIGNYVNEEVLGNVYVSELSYNHASLTCKNMKRDGSIEPISYSINYDNMSPIPLTEGILLKCGFEKIPTYTVMGSMIKDIGRNRMLSIGCIGTPNEILFVQQVEGKQVKDLVCIHNYDYDGKLYLHKLQNIIQIFTEKELEINL